MVQFLYEWTEIESEGYSEAESASNYQKRGERDQRDIQTHRSN